MGKNNFVDIDESVEQGWYRDQEDEFGIDAYSASVRLGTIDGTSNFRVINEDSSIAFSAASDGDGYFARNLGVGTENPVEKLEVIGVTKTDGLQVTENPVTGYVLTSDNDGVATWQPPASAGGGITEAEHRDLDQLVHDIAETSFTEYTYISFRRISNITTWTDQSKTTKIRESQITYTGPNRVGKIITIQYDASGVEAERLTETFTYSGNRLENVERTFS